MIIFNYWKKVCILVQKMYKKHFTIYIYRYYVIYVILVNYNNNLFIELKKPSTCSKIILDN